MELERASDPGALLETESEIDIILIDPKHLLLWKHDSRGGPGSGGCRAAWARSSNRRDLDDVHMNLFDYFLHFLAIIDISSCTCTSEAD